MALDIGRGFVFHEIVRGLHARAVTPVITDRVNQRFLFQRVQHALASIEFEVNRLFQKERNARVHQIEFGCAMNAGNNADVARVELLFGEHFFVIAVRGRLELVADLAGAIGEGIADGADLHVVHFGEPVEVDLSDATDADKSDIKLFHIEWEFNGKG